MQRVHSRGQNGKQVGRHGLLKPTQFAVRSHAGRLFRHELFPSESPLLELLLNRPPGASAPNETFANRRAILRRAFFDFVSETSRGSRSEGSHLPVPAGGEVAPQEFHPAKLTDRQKVLGKLGLSPIDGHGLDQLFPALVSEQGHKAKIAVFSQMRVNLESRFSLFLKGDRRIQVGRMPEQDFLRFRNLKVNLLDEGYQVVPWFAVRSSVLSGIDSG